MSVQFENNSIVVKNLLKDAALSFLSEAAGEVKSQVQRNSRVDTGQTKGSYSYNVDGVNLKATIGSDLDNAIYEEFGTGEYALYGNGRKGGWVYTDAKGERHFTHGKTPNRPLHKAYISSHDKIIRVAEEKFGGVGK